MTQYGGYFGSAIFRFWEEQNKKIQSGALQAHYLRLDTLGIENGCIDAVSQATSWPQIAYNNTYNFPLINKTTYDEFIHNITKPDDGCIAIIQKCRDVAAVGDPQFTANNKTVNDCFAPAAEQCLSGLQIASTYANRANFDIAQIAPGSFPGYQHVAFFNQRWVQRSLGVPLNYTDNIQIGINDLYFAIDGDAFRQNQTSIEYLLKNDIQVALVYGDRDTRCNWIGVENVSLTVDYPGAHNFRSAGYANLQTNKSYTGGVVRQYDGFSVRYLLSLLFMDLMDVVLNLIQFSRVFEAGHQVSSFQPETVSQIFDRVMFRRDIATGKVAAGFEQDPSVKGFSSRLSGFIGWGLQQAKSVSHYQSKGPSSSWSIKHKLPPSPPVVCNLWAVGATCTENQIAALSNGTAVIDGCYITSPAS